MARINFEVKIFHDRRFQNLILEVGDADKALGMLVNAWLISFEYYKNNRSLIPKISYLKHGLSEVLIKVGLAREENDFIYVCGSKKHHEWYHNMKEAGKKGGIAKSLGKKSSLATLPVDLGNLTLPSYSSSSSSYKNKKENIYISAQNVQIVEEWKTMLVSLSLPARPFKGEDMQLAALVDEYGYEHVSAAIKGLPFQQGSAQFDPKQHIRVSYLRNNIERLARIMPKTQTEEQKNVDSLNKSFKKTRVSFEALKELSEKHEPTKS